MKLSIQNLSCSIAGNKVLNNIDLLIENEQSISLLGPSGCGKTTLLRCIAGIQELEQGKISLDEIQLADKYQLIDLDKRSIGLIFQDYALFPHMNVQDNIGYGLTNKDKKNKKELVDRYLKLVKLENLAKRYPHELSGGQQQRVAIARALARQPKLLLLDEPFSNLDSNLRLELVQEIKELLKSQDIMSILVTHSKDEAFVFADHIAIMNCGNIIQFSSNQELYSKPNCKFVAEFLGPVNYLHVTAVTPYCLKFQNHQFELQQNFTDVTNQPLLANNDYHWLIRPNQIRVDRDNQIHDGPFMEIVEKNFHGSYFSYLLQENDLFLLAHSTYNLNIQDKVRVSFNLEQPVIFSLN